MIRQPARLYTAIAGIFLLAQGISTLVFRLYPPLDQAFPQLLAVTQMVPPHSMLHILTGLLALAALYWGGERGVFWFAAGFGLFYTLLALYGMMTMQPTVFRLQSFDHPFHLLLGVLGLAAAGIAYYRPHIRKKVSL
jgi:hypothetical protein